MNPPPGSSICIEEIERAAIQQALQENRYNKTKAAALGITFRAPVGAHSGATASPASPYPNTQPPNPRPRRSGSRSEEHTSELQSLMRISYAVFCLKKKNIKKQHTTTTHELTQLNQI